MSAAAPGARATRTLRYKRSAANVIGSDETIPAKTFDVPLTT